MVLLAPRPNSGGEAALQPQGIGLTDGEHGTQPAVVMDALENVFVSDVLILHCHEDGDCQEPNDRHSERSHVGSEVLQSADVFHSEHSHVSSELQCCQDEGLQVIGWCRDQDAVCQLA